MIKPRKHNPLVGVSPVGSSALAVVALVALASSGCDEAVDIPNQPAVVRAVGNIDGPVEGCEATSASRTSALNHDAGADAHIDAGVEDIGVTDDTGVDVGTDDVGVAQDTGVNDDAGVTEDTGVTEDAGVTQDAGVTEDAGVTDDTGVTEDAGADEDAGDAEGPSPSPVGAKISRDGSAVVIPYVISDLEGDDQRIRVEICQWDGQEASACGVAVQARGGDGSTIVPVPPGGACVLHVFYWDAGCGRFVGTDNGAGLQREVFDSVDQQLVARVSIVDSNQDPRQTEPFSLAALGFESVPVCE